MRRPDHRAGDPPTYRAHSEAEPRAPRGRADSSRRADPPTVVEQNGPVGWSRRIAAVLLLGLTVGGWVGGISFVTDPSGKTLGMSPQQLPNWPLLVDYTGPGLLLIVLFGVLPIPALVAVVRRPQMGWPATAAVGALLVVWMLVQVAALGLLLPGMQWAFLALGVLLVGLAASSRLRRR